MHVQVVALPGHVTVNAGIEVRAAHSATDHINTKIVETRCDRIGNGRKTGPQLNRLRCGIPLIKCKQKIYAAENKDEENYHHNRRFNEDGSFVVSQ